MATLGLVTAAGAACLLYYTGWADRIPFLDCRDRSLLIEDGEDEDGRIYGKGSYGGNRRSRIQRPMRPPSTWVEAMATLAETLRFTYSETLGKWPIGDLAFGINYMLRSQGDTRLVERFLEDAERLTGPDIAEQLRQAWRLIDICWYFSKKPFPQFLAGTGFVADDVLLREARARLLKPAFVVLVDDRFRCILLIIRGTHSMKDTLTAVTGAVVPFHHTVIDAGGVSRLVLGYAHCGMVAAARWIAQLATPVLREALQKRPGYNVKIVGHSLGGGTGALLTFILREKPGFEGTHCVAFGPAACMTWELSLSGESCVTSIVNGCDLVPTFSAASVDDLRAEVTASAWLSDLREQLEKVRIMRMVMGGAAALRRFGGAAWQHIPSSISHMSQGSLGAYARVSTQGVVRRAQTVAEAMVRMRAAGIMGPYSAAAAAAAAAASSSSSPTSSSSLVVAGGGMPPSMSTQLLSCMGARKKQRSTAAAAATSMSMAMAATRVMAVTAAMGMGGGGSNNNSSSYGYTPTTATVLNPGGAATAVAAPGYPSMIGGKRLSVEGAIDNNNNNNNDDDGDCAAAAAAAAGMGMGMGMTAAAATAAAAAGVSCAPGVVASAMVLAASPSSPTMVPPPGIVIRRHSAPSSSRSRSGTTGEQLQQQQRQHQMMADYDAYDRRRPFGPSGMASISGGGGGGGGAPLGVHSSTSLALARLAYLPNINVSRRVSSPPRDRGHRQDEEEEDHNDDDDDDDEDKDQHEDGIDGHDYDRGAGAGADARTRSTRRAHAHLLLSRSRWDHPAAAAAAAAASASSPSSSPSSSSPTSEDYSRHHSLLLARNPQPRNRRGWTRQVRRRKIMERRASASASASAYLGATSNQDNNNNNSNMNNNMREWRSQEEEEGDEEEEEEEEEEEVEEENGDDDEFEEDDEEGGSSRAQDHIMHHHIDMAEDIRWQVLEDELRRFRSASAPGQPSTPEEMAAAREITAEEEEVASIAASEGLHSDGLADLDPDQQHRFYPPGFLMHIIRMGPSSARPSTTDNNTTPTATQATTTAATLSQQQQQQGPHKKKRFNTSTASSSSSMPATHAEPSTAQQQQQQQSPPPPQTGHPLVGIYRTDRKKYGKIVLSRTMISDHYMPNYKKNMADVVEEIELEMAEEESEFESSDYDIPEPALFT